MKILLAHNYYQQPGGEDTAFRAERDMLKEYGHTVIEYTDHNDRIKIMSPMAVARDTIWSTYSYNRILQIVKKEKPDIAHFQNTFPLISPSAYYACYRAGLPVVQILQNYRFMCPAATLYRNNQICKICIKKILPWPSLIYSCYHSSLIHTVVLAAMLTIHRWLRTWQKQVNAYIALTQFGRKLFIESGLPEERIFIKPNFIYPEPQARETNGSYVLFVGRLSKEKGISTMLRAWKLLKDIPLKIAGDGPLMNEVKNIVNNNKMKNIEILGFQTKEQIISLIKGSKFLVFPSEWYEGLPLTIIEAFACGVPIIASRLGAMEEIIHNGYTGLHFIPGNYENLAEKIEWSWVHKEKMEEMGENARKEFEEKYTSVQNFKILNKIYENAINMNRR